MRSFRPGWAEATRSLCLRQQLPTGTLASIRTSRKWKDLLERTSRCCRFWTCARSSWERVRLSGLPATASKVLVSVLCSTCRGRNKRAAEHGTNPDRYEGARFAPAFSFESCTITAGVPQRLRRPAYVL